MLLGVIGIYLLPTLAALGVFKREDARACSSN